jgi:hypothetical protein
MKSRNSRFFVLIAILVIALSQIMCNTVTVDFPEEFPLLFGVEVDESFLESEVFNVEANITRNDCRDIVPVPEMGLVESFEFSDKSLVITHPNGRTEYTKLDRESRTTYCRYPDLNHYICIDFRNENSYQIRVYDITPPVPENEYDRVCYAADRFLSTIDDLLLSNEGDTKMEESQSEDAVDSNDEDNQDNLFSADDCLFCGLSIPLSSSSASNNTYKMGVTSEVQVEVTGHLTCDWQGDYKSENKTGTIMIYLNVYKFDNAQDAQILFNKFHNDAASKLPYCNKDDSCTVAIAEFGEDRAYYVWENIYVGGKGELPSDHGANLARLITTAEKYYVLDLLVTHPELDTGNAWVSDTAESVEACVMNIINW